MLWPLCLFLVIAVAASSGRTTVAPQAFWDWRLGVGKAVPISPQANCRRRFAERLCGLGELRGGGPTLAKVPQIAGNATAGVFQAWELRCNTWKRVVGTLVNLRLGFPNLVTGRSSRTGFEVPCRNMLETCRGTRASFLVCSFNNKLGYGQEAESLVEIWKRRDLNAPWFLSIALCKCQTVQLPQAPNVKSRSFQGACEAATCTFWP